MRPASTGAGAGSASSARSLLAGRDHDDAVALEPCRRPRSDPGAIEVLLRQTQPAAAADHDRAFAGLPAHRLFAHAPVANVDEPVCDRGRGRVMADDHDGAALGGGELGDRVVDQARARLVELAGRLVGEEEPRTMGNRRTERDPLLLAARELSRIGRGSRSETDPFEEPARAGFALLPLDALRTELQAHELLRGQLGRQRSCVVLVEVADRARPVARAATGAERAQVVPEHAHGSGRGQVEPGEDSQERRLA